MNKAMASLVMVSLFSSVALAADDIPASWEEFKASKKDAAMVAKIEKAKWFDLCVEYGKAVRAKADTRRSNAVRDFLMHDDTLTSRDLGSAKKREISIGMSQCGVLASLGHPDKSNDTTNAHGKTSQWVYRDQSTYVYLEQRSGNMFVTSWQN